MVNWYVDEGLKQFDRQWLELHPGATIWHIGDILHSTDPDVSQHAPDRGGALPGDDKGEIDAGDYPLGKSVTIYDLREAFAGLHKQRDPRLLYAILEDKIFSSVVRPWEIRPYKGKYHNHLHLSVNDKFDNNPSYWQGLMPEETVSWKYKEVPDARLPEELRYGMEDDTFLGWDHILRVQALLPCLAPGSERLELDGVYGANTAAMVRKVFGGTGKILTFENIKRLHGLN
jgi:hypothetical protein